VIGIATRTGPCGTVTRTIAATIVANAKPQKLALTETMKLRGSP
jgi:hypothetical protein